MLYKNKIAKSVRYYNSELRNCLTQVYAFLLARSRDVTQNLNS